MAKFTIAILCYAFAALSRTADSGRLFMTLSKSVSNGNKAVIPQEAINGLLSAGLPGRSHMKGLPNGPPQEVGQQGGGQSALLGSDIPLREPRQEDEPEVAPRVEDNAGPKPQHQLPSRGRGSHSGLRSMELSAHLAEDVRKSRQGFGSANPANRGGRKLSPKGGSPPLKDLHGNSSGESRRADKSDSSSRDVLQLVRGL